jgi:hypothetical protein
MNTSSSLHDVIAEAWRLCKERQVSRIGKEPARWRFFARRRWRTLRSRLVFDKPNVDDVLQAAHVVDADYPTTVKILAVMAHG